MKLYIADAFTEEAFGGNPAGVVLLEPSSPFPPEETMRKIAAELRYSETAFVRPAAPCGGAAGGETAGASASFALRYFTPVAEVELCGHATIAAFCVLQDAGLALPGRSYSIATGAGTLGVEIDGGGRVMMECGNSETLSCSGDIDGAEALARLYGAMGRSGETGANVNVPRVFPPGGAPRLFPRIAAAGLPDIMLPVESREALNALAPDMAALARLSEEYGVTGVHAFALNDGEGPSHITAFCRNFAPLFGIPEEAATGTASGALVYYLHQAGLLRPGDSCAFLQGEAMGRPSMIYGRLLSRGSASNAGEPARISVQVGGSAVLLVRGQWLP
ncbi:MAG: PhzF family phenazine biosynthesis protein [Bacillota bacterium]|nr:PhzF family phenazine biosynthesis protein [Bacillota bacterium]